MDLLWLDLQTWTRVPQERGEPLVHACITENLSWYSNAKCSPGNDSNRMPILILTKLLGNGSSRPAVGHSVDCSLKKMDMVSSPVMRFTEIFSPLE